MQLRHHCRVCSSCLCWECANRELVVPFSSEVVRVCRPCKDVETRQTLAPLYCEPPLTDAQFKLWQEVLAQRELMNPLESELNRLVREGVPSGLRATVWPGERNERQREQNRTEQSIAEQNRTFHNLGPNKS